MSVLITGGRRVEEQGLSISEIKNAENVASERGRVRAQPRERERSQQPDTSLAGLWSSAPAVTPTVGTTLFTMVNLSAVGITLFTSFGCMAVGIVAQQAGVFSAEARKGIATLYAKIVFPTMVFVGVAGIDMGTIDTSLVLVMLASKAVLAALIVAYCIVTLRDRHGADTLAHAGALAMAASHSFDVTLGVPLCHLLFPAQTAYVYLNQSVQLVLVNPVLLILIETAAGSGGSGRRIAVAKGVLTNPLVVMTVLGLTAGQLFPAGLPAAPAALAKQLAAAGPFLGFLTLGFALAGLGGTAPTDLGLAAVLCAAKLVLMPLLYTAFAARLGCTAAPDYLHFLGTLPASASVYSLTLTKQLSPSVVGPLVPASMLLCVALCVLPLWPAAVDVHAPTMLRALVALLGALGMRAAAGAAAAGKPNQSGSSKQPKATATKPVASPAAVAKRRSASPARRASKKAE